ncbi:MAG: LacI family transcriptional regulator [Bacteroidales bacterium]|nr:LacI family transcriptional regulator [Bacteroidales bacterium]
MNNRKTNIKDIAEYTGLSITTVSRVLNGKAKQYRISDKSKYKILEAAEALNYTPNQIAVNLQSGRTRTIALIVPTLMNPYFSRIAGMINLELQRMGYATLISDCNENPEIENEELKQMTSRNVEGIIIAPCGKSPDQINFVQNLKIPIICLDRYYEGLDIPFVSSDNYQGAYLATKHFIKNGHTSIACIHGIESSTPNKYRIKGFLAALEEAGLQKNSISGYDFSVQNGYTETLLLLHKIVKPTAIFALSNTIALGCMKALKENNIRIPEDISLIAFDDHPYLDYLSTPLTCVSQPVDDICKIAVRLIFNRINNEESKANQIFLHPSLIFRESVKQLK